MNKSNIIVNSVTRILYESTNVKTGSSLFHKPVDVNLLAATETWFLLKIIIYFNVFLIIRDVSANPQAFIQRSQFQKASSENLRWEDVVVIMRQRAVPTAPGCWYMTSPSPKHKRLHPQRYKKMLPKPTVLFPRFKNGRLPENKSELAHIYERKHIKTEVPNTCKYYEKRRNKLNGFDNCWLNCILKAKPRRTSVFFSVNSRCVKKFQIWYVLYSRVTCE